jgi:putative DNA primase/helicase
MNAEQLAQALGAVRSGRQWKCCCIAHEDRSPSMIIFDGRESVQVRCMAGCEPEDIIAVLRSRGLWAGVDRDGYQRGDLDAKSVSRETLSEDRRTQQLRLLARCIFDDAQPIRGTIAQKYFESRDLWSVACEIDDIRFHPRCPREKGEQPAVVVAMRSIASRAITAIQRIFLDRQGRKLGKGMMLGTCSGAAMQLLPKIGGTLHIAEGLETGLACIAMDRAPTWALGSAALIQTFPVIGDIDRLVIWADHDPLQKIGGVWCRPGHKAAGICMERWLKANKQVEVETPNQEGWDEADVWSARCARL